MARGGRRGGGGGAPQSREVQVSKKLSWLLRHGAESEGLKLGPGGYANLAEVLQSRTIKSIKVTFDEIRQAVADNDKQRFSLIPVSEAAGNTDASDQEAATTSAAAIDFETDLSDPSNWLIRANQGHSIKVDEEGLLEPLTLESPDLPTTVVHGTTGNAWPIILKTGGLKPMTRTHVHFALGLPAGFTSLDLREGTAKDEEQAKQPVISGMRNTSKILIYLDLEKTLQAGLKVWKSANGVVLCSGNDDRIIPVDLFRLVESRGREGRILLRDGVVVDASP